MRKWIALTAALTALPISAGAEEAHDSGRFLPSVSAAAGRQGGRLFGNGWLGVAYLPSERAVSPFFAAGPEIDIRRHESAREEFTTVTLGPQLRAGISWFPDANKYMSAINAYALVGYRAPSAINQGALRVGLGASSPLVGILLLGAKLPLPWMAEVTADVMPHDYELAWRIGIAY
jgi:hypothetical protein